MHARDVLAALSRGGAVSGTRLAEQSGLTRAAIWKQVESLRSKGVPIQSHGLRGYCLPWPLQMLDAAAIECAIPPALRPGALAVHWELDSTSSQLQRQLDEAPDLSMVLAETQSAGRGRRGRHWLSPPGMNLYLSCLKRFDRGFAALTGLSLALGVIVLGVLDTLGLTGAGLKWPNDLLSERGKLGGILVELNGEYQGPCAAVIGIGLNLRLTDALRTQAGQPSDDLAALAGGVAPDRNHVAALLIAALVDGLRRFEREGFAGFVADYRRYDRLRGVPLRLSGALGDLEGIGAGVDARGALLLDTATGQRAIDSADVSVRRA